MRIKKYTGLTTYEAMAKMKQELGSDAIILNTRTIREKGFFGIFKKPMIEITAAFEDKSKGKWRTPRDDKLQLINNELLKLRNMMENISKNIVDKESDIPKELEKYKTILVENGVEPSTVISILEELNRQVNLEGKSDGSIKNLIKYTLMEYIGDVKPLNLDGHWQKVIFFIGPTGIGKTTTLAKIAGQLVMDNNYDIGLVTSDTYRIAAVEQLKTYSDILKLPLRVIYNEEDMYKTLLYYKDKDIIFVDTAGRSHKDMDKEDAIFKIMNSIKNKEVYLVLGFTTEYNTLKSIIEHYKFIEDYKIILTKLDEVEGIGNILNIRSLTDKPISYITTGQNVPDDIEILDKTKIINRLIGES